MPKDEDELEDQPLIGDQKREAHRSVGGASIPGDAEGPKAEGPKTLSSNALRALQHLKGDLVIQLFTRHGPFWEEIKGLRDRWDVKAYRQLPSLDIHYVDLMVPESFPGRPEEGEPPSQEWWRFHYRWCNDLLSIRECVLPRRYLDSKWLIVWKNFIALCTLYDPPETDLLAFAQYGDPQPRPYSIPWTETPNRGQLPRMAMPPIEPLWYDPSELKEAEGWYWERLIHELGERHLKPRGLDVYSLMEDTLLEAPWIREEHEKMVHAAKLKDVHYIKIDEWVTEGDVRNAFRMLAASSKDTQIASGPRRDQLVAVQCALLYDRHNTTDTKDKRRRKWTYERLARTFELKGARAARDHVRVGRKILEKSR